MVLLDPEGRLREMPVRTPFTDTVKLEGQNGQGAALNAELNGLSARTDGEALFLSASFPFA